MPNTSNSRNGHGSKTIIVDNDQFTIRSPRDRNGSFEPQLIPKRQTRFKGFDEKILAMDARGMSVRDMQAMLLELYQVEVSEALISSVTDAIKLIYLAMQNIAKKWTMPLRNRGAVINQFSITFEGRVPLVPPMKTTVDTLG
ncbi:transposase [Chlorobaculum tepidum]|uniref:transposase n=1 Tax=Chlorobaculum tepidum TaxID=1097 RepID=UPI0002FCDFBB